LGVVACDDINYKIIYEMGLDIELLKKISETAGAPGFEKRIREFVSEEIKPFVDSVEVDNMGNLIAFRKGASDKKIMLAAHMDEIGFIVSHIDDNGFVRFLPLGGFDPKTLSSQRVIIHGKEDVVGVMGTKPVHLMSPEERNKAVQLKDFFIDLGMSKEEVEAVVSVGDSITRQRELIEMGNCINGKSLDNRISVFVLLEAMKELKDSDLPCDTYAVFSVQEEVGLRGAQVAALGIQPDFGVAIDTTIAFDVPGAQPHETVSELGKGAAIKIMDSSVICDTRMRSYMEEVAKKKELVYQFEMLPAGGTDSGMIQRMVKGGAITGAVSIPTRHIHQVIETVHKIDVENAIALVTGVIAELDGFKMEY